MVENRLAPLALAAGIGLASLGMAPAANAADFLLTSPAFKDGGMLAVKNAGNQQREKSQLRWSECLPTVAVVRRACRH